MLRGGQGRRDWPSRRRGRWRSVVGWHNGCRHVRPEVASCVRLSSKVKERGVGIRRCHQRMLSALGLGSKGATIHCTCFKGRVFLSGSRARRCSQSFSALGSIALFSMKIGSFRYWSSVILACIRVIHARMKSLSQWVLVWLKYLVGYFINIKKHHIDTLINFM